MTYKEKSKILECTDYICLQESCAEQFFFYEERGRDCPFLFHRNSVSKDNGAPFVSYRQQLESSHLNTRKKKRRKTEHLNICGVTNVLITQSTDNTTKSNINLKRRQGSPRLACPVLTFTRAYISPALFITCRKRDRLRSKPLPSQEHLISLHFSKLSRFSLKS